MDDLVAFVKARLDEDEAVAQAAGADGHDRWIAAWGTVVDAADPDNFAMITDSVNEVCAHIALHDPARVLREVAAKRAILSMYDDGEGYAYSVAMERVLVQLATSWSDHPDYRAEWKP